MPPADPPVETAKEKKKREKRERKAARKQEEAAAPAPADGKKKKKKKKMEEDDEDALERMYAQMDEEGDLEASEEELLEELQNDMATLVQRQARALKARRTARNMILASYVKEWDAEFQRMGYRNKVTGVLQRTKPKLLGDLDLPDPQVFEAPEGYATPLSDRRQFALCVSNTRFNDEDRLPPLEEVVERDHDGLRKYLINPYICKFLEEDCLFMKNCSKNVFQAQLEALHDIVKKANQAEKSREGGGKDWKPKGTLFVYVATHIATHKAGGPYFCFNDSNATNNDSLRRTALRVKDFCKVINKIPCREKTVILDCCHLNRPPSKEAARQPVVIYPPPDLYKDIARLAECRVLGSCKLGGGEQRTPDFGRQVREEEEAAAAEEAVRSAVWNFFNFYATASRWTPPTRRDVREGVRGWHRAPSTPRPPHTIPTQEESRRAELLRKFRTGAAAAKFVRKTQVAALVTKRAAAPAPAEAPAPAPAPAPADEDPLSLDQKVEADYRGTGTYYSAIVSGAHADGTYDITYKDGERETSMERHLIRLIEEEVVDEEVVEEEEAEEERVEEEEDRGPSSYARLCEALRCCPKMKVNQEDPRNIEVEDEVAQLYAMRWCLCDMVRRQFQKRAQVRREKRELRRKDKREKAARDAATYERAFYVDGHSLFGGAVVAALKGEAAEMDYDRVSVENVFAKIEEIVDAEVTKRRAVQAAAQGVKDAADDAEELRLVEATQIEDVEDEKVEEPDVKDLTTDSLELISGEVNEQGLRRRPTTPGDDARALEKCSRPTTPNDKGERAREAKEKARAVRKARTLAIRELAKFKVARKTRIPDALVSQTPQAACGRRCERQYTTLAAAPALPPAPDPPVALKTRARSALLHWANPPFSGTPPVQYDVESKGTAKFDSQAWARCGAFTTIGTDVFQAPHLVPGMAVYFRVRARNQAGWGAWSESSDRILPVANKLVGLAEDMREAGRKGVPYVLQKMKHTPNVAEAQKLGSWQLATVATKARGFKRRKVAQDVANVILRAMRTFSLEATMQARGCLVLGWCFFRHADVARRCQDQAVDAIERAREHFPEDVGVQSNAQWALARLYPDDGDTVATQESPAKLSQPGTPGRDALFLSPSVDPEIEAYAAWLEDYITREAENAGFLEGR